jgi:hypothetical protein
VNATAEVIDGVARDVRDEPVERGLAVIPEQRAHLMSGLGAVALLSDEEFQKNLELLTKGKQRAQAIQKAILTEGTDYGKVPGIDRPFLHKPGAEVMEKAYGLATSYTIERKVGNGDDVPALEYIVHAKVHLGDTDGPIVAEGVGSCNTHESKYRFRQGQRECPDCHKPAIIKGKADGKLKGKWWCASFKDGCGHTFEEDDPRLKDQQVGQVENENPYDLANTILKMARKRAGVDGILTATGTSGLFTQDDDSPAVTRDAAAAPPPSADRDQEEGQRSTASASSGSRQTGVKLPAIPRDLTEKASLGVHSLTGTATVSSSGPNSGELRQTPDGALLGFRMEFGGNAKINRVFARGPVAEQLAEALVDPDGNPNPQAIVGQTVTVTGEVFAIPWTKKNDEGIEEPMPPFREMTVTAIQWGDRRLPVEATAAAKPDPKQTTVADAAHTANQAAAAGGPGMTPDALVKALDNGRVAKTYAAAQAKELFGVKSLADLTDQQRLALAAALDLIGPDEEEDQA